MDESAPALATSAMVAPLRSNVSPLISPSSSDSIKQPPIDVHTQLGRLLRSYAVFRPTPSADFPLFQVGLLLSSPASRVLSPRRTSANLYNIFSSLHASSHQQSESFLNEPSISSDVIQAFLHEFAKLRIPSPLEGAPQPAYTLTVSEASLFRAGVNLGPCATRRHSNMRQITLSHVSTEEYAGGRTLHDLIWSNAEVVFRKVLLEIDMNLGSRRGDRHLIAIVTKRVHANVSVSKSTLKAKKSRSVARPGRARNSTTSMTHDRSLIVQGLESVLNGTLQEACDSYRGICGLQLLVFPVEVLDRLKWRVYRVIELDDVEHRHGTLNPSVLRFAQAQKWHLKQDNDLYPSFEDLGMNADGKNFDQMFANPSYQRTEGLPLERCRAESEAGSTVTDHAMHEDSSNQSSFHSSSEERKPSGMETGSHPWVDVDFSSDVNEFALQQCKLAGLYNSLGVEQHSAHSLSLLRSALQKCCLESAAQALLNICECYEKGIGVKKSEIDGGKLRFCVQFWEEHRQCAVSLDLLRKDRKFCDSKEPERRLLQLLRESGLHRGLKRGRDEASARDEMPVHVLSKLMRSFQTELDDTASRMVELERQIVAKNPLADLEPTDDRDPPLDMDGLYLRQSQIEELLGGIDGGEREGSCSSPMVRL